MSGRTPGRLAVLLIAMATTLAACRTPSASDGAAARPRSFTQAFALYERRRGSEEVEPPRTTLVDYESELLVAPDRARLAAIAGRSGPKPPTEEVRRIERRMDAIEEGLAPALRSIVDFEEASRTYFADLTARDGDVEPVALQADPLWRARETSRLDVVERLRFLAYSSISATEFGGAWENWDAEGEEGLALMGIAADDVPRAFADGGALYARMAPAPDRFEPAEVTRLANQLVETLRTELEALEAAVLADAQPAELQMEAALLRGEERIPISIQPYFRVEGVERGAKSPRVGIPSKADMERVAEHYAAIGEVADSMNELIELAGDGAFEALRDELLAGLDRIARSLTEGLAADLKALIDVDGEALADVRSKAEALRAELVALVASVRDLRERAPSMTPVELVRAIAALAGSFPGGELRDDLKELVASLDALPDTLGADVLSAVRTLRERAEDELAGLADDLAQLPAGGALARLYASLREVSRLARARSFGDLEPGPIERRPFEVHEAPDGLVNLAATPAEHGDVVETRYLLSLVDEDPPTVYEGRHHHDVRKFGFYSTYTAQLLFYDRHGDGSSTMRAAPGVCWNLHYRPEGSQQLFDLLAPGLGLGLFSPSVESGTELAVGAQLTLFNDMVQIGYGYNVSVDDDPDLVYFGFGLIEIFQAFQ